MTYCCKVLPKLWVDVRNPKRHECTFLLLLEDTNIRKAFARNQLAFVPPVVFSYGQLEFYLVRTFIRTKNYCISLDGRGRACMHSCQRSSGQPPVWVIPVCLSMNNSSNSIQ